MNQNTDYTPVALYARVSSDRQDVDLSISAQLRALRDYVAKNGYIVAREYVDEAESAAPSLRAVISSTGLPVARALLNHALNAAIGDTQRLGSLNGRRTVNERCGGAQRQRSHVHRVSPPLPIRACV